MNRHKSVLSLILISMGILGSMQLGYGVEGIITNTDGRTFEGEIKAMPNGSIELQLSADSGSVSYNFLKENLAGIEFLDAENLEDGLEAYGNGQYQVAITFLESIHRSRSPFLKIYPKEEFADPSLVLGSAYLKIERFAEAAGLAGTLLNLKFEDPGIHDQANELLLMAYFGLRRWDETEILAKRWCENHDPADETALGWWILSEVHLAREELEKARWISLQPITFSSQYPKAYLQECFHVAIAAWIETSPEQALQLYRQYQDRGYVWPEGKQREIQLKLTGLGLRVEDEPTQEESKSLEIEEGQPEKDLNLPLETVRKLTTKTESGNAP
ncbi:MAG: hypothetical protein O3C43_03750 [Verrucomicrobia bacterium]|nr:hypothetical protein [Verrucomicrobiota bacterium]MDA1065596.1 hypothetical protein [Verrucomicrobiota bacterium]